MYKDRLMIVSILTLLSGLGVWGMDQAGITEFTGLLVDFFEKGSVILSIVLVALGVKSKE